MKSADTGNFKDVKSGGRITVLTGGTMPSGKPGFGGARSKEFNVGTGGTQPSGRPTVGQSRPAGKTEFHQITA